MKQAARNGLNSNQLKSIAIGGMLIQHTVIILMDCTSLLGRILCLSGRITAPIMCFFIAEGYYHTSNLKRYTLRLFIAAVVSHIPHALAFGFSPLDVLHATSIMWPLFLGLVALAVCKDASFPVWAKVGIVLACCALAYPGNFNCIAVLWILSFGLFRDAPKRQAVSFCLVTALYFLESFIISSPGSAYCRFVAIAALPLIWFYNGRRGKNTGAVKYGFYSFYPCHLLILYALHFALK